MFDFSNTNTKCESLILKGVTPVERISAGMMLEVKTGDGMVFWPATILRFVSTLGLLPKPF